MIAFEQLVVELKAVSSLNSDHEAQVLNYRRIARSSIGYLSNFGPIGKLEFKRLILSEFLS